MSDGFYTTLRVRYSECDPQGVVFNAHYVEFVDIALTEFYRVVCGGYEKVIALGAETQVVSVKVDWSSSARVDDVVRASVTSLTLGNTSFTFTVDMHEHFSNRLLAKASITYVTVDAKQFTKIEIPAAVRELLQRDHRGKSIDLAGLSA